MDKHSTDKINIAIDGYSACGKSTLAIDLAECLKYIYLDSGAMYRAVTLYFQKKGLNYLDSNDLDKGLESIEIGFDRSEGDAIIVLNGEDVSKEIRSLKVTDEVSQIAKISEIRRFLVAKQQRIAENKGVIMEGRDIGTVVLPRAEFKIFLTAESSTRVNRRYLQLKQAGIKASRESIKKNLEERDRIDSNRKDSPLKCAEDAMVIDNTHMSTKDQLFFVLKELAKRFPLIKNYCKPG